MFKHIFTLFGVIICVVLTVSQHAAGQTARTALSEDQARALVRKLYEEKLGREPDAQGLQHHMRLLLEEGKDARWIAEGLENSPEGLKLRHSRQQTRWGIALLCLVSLALLVLIGLCRKNERTTLLASLLYVLWILLLFESTVRLYFTSVLHTDIFHPEQALQAILLPEYATSAEEQDTELLRTAGGCRILLLGASVLDPHFGDIAAKLRSSLGLQGADTVQIFNYACAAQSTRDSRFKYLYLLKDYRFDFVVIYHGINEVRANNCPDGVFQEDYSHYAWYEDLNLAERHLEGVRFTVLPFVADLLYHRIRQHLFPSRYVPVGEPSPDWISQGRQLKTQASFRKNLEDIITTARSRSTRVILMTFATYVPSSYTRKAYEEKKLDYVGRGYPIELWGEPANVVRGVASHNQVIREIAADNPDVILLDMEKSIPKEGKYFADICHLSRQYGSDAFVQPLAELLARQCRE